MVRHFSKTVGYTLKPHHYIRLNQEFKLDCQVWLSFLTNPDLSRVIHRPMLDVSQHCTSNQISFYSDASHAIRLGFGCTLDKQWLFGQWLEGFISQQEPSIEFLELFALTAGVLTWENHLSLTNTRVTVFCDNMSVVHMINNISSSCFRCMKLIRLLVLNGLQFNCRLSARFISTKNNSIADALSHLQFDRFRKLAPNKDLALCEIDERIWPIYKVW